MATQKKFIADLGFETPGDLTVNGNATFDGNATVTGNLTVNGTSTTVNSTTTSVTDSMIELANANTGSDTLDIGIYGNYDDGLSDGGASEYTGLFRDASDSTWKLFDGLEAEPTTTVNTAGTGYAKAALEVGDLSCTTLTATNSMTGASLSYPTSDGTAGQVIKTDGNGTLSFTTISGYTDSDVETYLDGGTSTPTFSTATVTGTATVNQLNINSATYDNRQLGMDSNGFFIYNSADARYDMVIKDDGNLGLGHDTPQFRLTIPQASDDSGKIGWEDGSNNKRASILCNSSNDRLEFRTGTSDNLRMSIHGTNEDIHIGEETSDVLLYIGSQGGAYGGNSSNWIRASGGTFMYNSGNGSHIWEATGTQKMQLKSDGTLMLNRTSSFGAADSTPLIVTGKSESCAYWTAPNTSGYDIHTFFNGGLGVIGTIEQNSSLNGVAYNTSSDYRLKENVNDSWDATTILKQLRPVEYNFISDPNDTYQQGFIAHELAEHLPFAVSGEKDAVIPAVLYQETDQEVIDGEALVGDIKEEEKIKPQQVDYSKVVALLVKTIQELEARITTLESA